LRRLDVMLKFMPWRGTKLARPKIAMILFPKV